MKTNIYLRKVELGKEKKDMLIKKIDKLGKFFDEEASADIVVAEQKDKMIVEVTIRTADMIYRAEERNEEVYNAADDVVDSVTRQIRKNKTRLAKKLREGVSKEFDVLFDAPEEEADIKIVKTKTHHVKPMSAEEAVLQMNLLGHNFFVFTNAKTNTTDIVYRRKDGNYGLIETD
ncbi:MAG: ribosome-associated translation inhibitor RaiA [Clostridia bacterium]|nr:ribosome-associated translation inhibitor RaiA [Clostridia bacterium]